MSGHPIQAGKSHTSRSSGRQNTPLSPRVSKQQVLVVAAGQGARAGREHCPHSPRDQSPDRSPELPLRATRNQPRGAQPEQGRSVWPRGPEVTARRTQTNTSLHTGPPSGAGTVPTAWRGPWCCRPPASGISHSTFRVPPAPNSFLNSHPTHGLPHSSSEAAQLP